MQSRLPTLFEAIESAAAERRWTGRQWAAAAGVRPETVSRLRRRGDCDLSTLAALAHAVGLGLSVVQPVPARGSHAQATVRESPHMPTTFGREAEARLLDLCAAGDPDIDRWRLAGPAFFMSGIAVMLGSVRGFSRRRYLDLAEALHPGSTTQEAFAVWLKRSPLRPSRFLPMLEKRRAKAT